MLEKTGCPKAKSLCPGRAVLILLINFRNQYNGASVGILTPLDRVTCLKNQSAQIKQERKVGSTRFNLVEEAFEGVLQKTVLLWLIRRESHHTPMICIYGNCSFVYDAQYCRRWFDNLLLNLIWQF